MCRVLFPGGSASLVESGYEEVGKLVYQLAKTVSASSYVTLRNKLYCYQKTYVGDTKLFIAQFSWIWHIGGRSLWTSFFGGGGGGRRGGGHVPNITMMVNMTIQQSCRYTHLY